MEERRLRVFENRVLKRIFGPKRDEVTGEWRKLHNDELCDLYCSPNIILRGKTTKNKTGGTRGTYGGEEEFIYGFFVCVCVCGKT